MKKNHFLVLSLGIGALILATQHAFAQGRVVCGTHADFVARLASSYGETRQSIGIAGDNSLLELFASTETGSWSILVTDAAGTACLVASGQAFERLAEALPEPGSDT